MARLPVPGSDDGLWGTLLNDFLSVELNGDGTLKKVALITGAEQTANKGATNGYAPLDSSSKIPAANLPLALTPVTLTDTATIATDASLSNHFRVTLGGNRTLGNPTNPTDGQKLLWEVIQDATGSRTLALGGTFAFGTEITSLALSLTANKRTFIGAVYNQTANKWYIIANTSGY